MWAIFISWTIRNLNRRKPPTEDTWSIIVTVNITIVKPLIINSSCSFCVNPWTFFFYRLKAIGNTLKAKLCFFNIIFW